MLTTLEMAVLAWPASVRPEECGPARNGLVTKTGTGSGSLTLSGAAFDALSVRVEIVTGGEIGTATWRAWTDGATWGDTQRTSTSELPILHSAADEITGGADTGLRIAFAAGAPASFNAGDRWDFTVKPVQAIVAAVRRAKHEAAGILGARYQGLASTTDAGLKGSIAALARLCLMERRGLDPASPDGKLYIDSAGRGRAHLIEVASKREHPQGHGEGPVYAPDVHLGSDRGGVAAAFRARTT